VPRSVATIERSTSEVLTEQLENVLTEDLDPIAEARAFKRYIELKDCDAKDLAQVLRVAPSTVTRALSLLKLPAWIQERIASEEIPPRTGYEIAKLKDDAARTAMAQRAIAERLTTEEVTRAVRQKRGRAGRKRGRAELLRVSNGIEVLVSTRRKLQPSDILIALKEALRLAQVRYGSPAMRVASVPPLKPIPLRRS
jgi:ParB family chromosome partitioning protein